MSWSDIFSGLFSGIGNNLGAIGQGAGLLGGGALVNEAYKNIGDVGQTALEKSNALAQQALNQTQFRPFTVTTGLGNLQATPEGGYGMTLSPEQQALQNQLFSGAQGFYSRGATQNMSPAQQALQNQLASSALSMYGQAAQGMTPEQKALQDQLMAGAQGFYKQATVPLAQRQEQVYNALRAVQMPEEERARLDLEQRLAGQGRLGLQTAQYGGAPESFALAKAQAEARNQASVAAIEQAMREQAQQADLGQAYQTMGYRPSEQALKEQAIRGELGSLFQKMGYMPSEQARAEQAQQAELGRLYQAGGYLPMSSLLSAYSPGLQGAQLASQMQQSGAGLFGEAAMGGINALLASRLAQGNLAGQLGQALLGGTMQGMLSQQQEQGASDLGAFLADLFA